MKETLYYVSEFIQLFVISACLYATFAWWYHSYRILGCYLRYKRIGVIGFITYNILERISCDQFGCLRNIIALSLCQSKPKRIHSSLRDRFSFVVNPPQVRPSACASCPPFFGEHRLHRSEHTSSCYQ